MKLQQHIDTLKEIESKLDGQYGDCTPVYGRHEFGQWVDVVNMAFAHWSALDAVASNRNYDDAERNEAADEADRALKVIKELAKELFEAEKSQKRLVATGNESGFTAVAQEFDEQLEDLRDLDAVYDAASNRRGY